MKKILAALLFLIHLNHVCAQKLGDSFVLKGYFIVSCFDTTIKSSCDLNVEKISSLYGDSMTCGDGAFYKNISTITFVTPEEMDLKKIDDFKYRIQLQKNEHHIILSTAPSILKETTIPAIVNNTDLINAIKQNQLTAEAIQKQIDGLNHDFKKKNCYILMEVSVKIIMLPQRAKPARYNDPTGLNQYLLLFDKKNRIKALKVLKDPF